MLFKSIKSTKRRPDSMSWLGLLVMLMLGTTHAADAPVKQAATKVTTEHVTAQLVASVAAVYPGAEIVLGVHQDIIPHWHTYWQNSGDSGIPTTIDWQLPQGAVAGDIEWPIPNRFAVGPVTNYGYAEQVTLLSSIKVPKDIKIGGTFPIHAKVNWLVCADICVPEEVVLGLDLPVAASSSQAGQGSPLIKQAQHDLPSASPWQTQVQYASDAIYLNITGSALHAEPISEVYFYAAAWGKVNHHAPQEISREGDAIILKLQKGEAPPESNEALDGVLVVSERVNGVLAARGFNITAPAAALTPHTGFKSQQAATPVTALSNAASDNLHLGTALLLALLGGVILNLMPCVFPVLSIKALSLLRHAEHSPAVARWHGVAYAAGILLSFSVLALVLVLLKAGGTQIGWGFQFQSPVFVVAVAYLIFAVGLSLSGVFTLGASVAGVGSSLANRQGYSGSFFTGVLATVVATPCTAPFMGAAIGFALSQSAWVLWAVFLSLGLGLALPYLLLSTWPKLQRALPKPGVWMERLKQFLAFPMYLATVWLLWVLSQQTSPNALALALLGLVLIAFAAWLYELSRYSPWRWSAHALAGLTVVLAVLTAYTGINTYAATPASVETSSVNHIWQPYSPDKLSSLLAQGKPVFVNLTAAWCISCLANERVALSNPQVQQAFQRAGVSYLKGDWTNQDAQISQLLKQFGRSGVPLYVAYPVAKNGEAAQPMVLPQILTPEIVLDAVKQMVESPAVVTQLNTTHS